MKPVELRLKCLAEQKEHYWQAFCLDLNLAVQGDSFDEVKTKLEHIIKSYVYDALVGEDKEFISQLIPRRAPASIWLKYYKAVLMHRVFRTIDGITTFIEPLPLVPQSICR